MNAPLVYMLGRSLWFQLEMPNWYIKIIWQFSLRCQFGTLNIEKLSSRIQFGILNVKRWKISTSYTTFPFRTSFALSIVRNRVVSLCLRLKEHLRPLARHTEYLILRRFHKGCYCSISTSSTWNNLGSGSSPIQERSISSKEIWGYNVIEVGGSLSSNSIHLFGLKSSSFSSFIFVCFFNNAGKITKNNAHFDRYWAKISIQSANSSQFLIPSR